MYVPTNHHNHHNKPTKHNQHMTKCTACSRKNPIFTPKPDGTNFKTCDPCRATQKRWRNNNKTKIKNDNIKWNKKWNPINAAKRSKEKAEKRYEAALALAETLNMKKPMVDDESEASARKILVDNEALFSSIEKEGAGLYVALCTQKTKHLEPYKGAVSYAHVTTKKGKKVPTSMELKNRFGWDHVSLGDFDFFSEAKHVRSILVTSK